jgi:proline iminopeptidase
MFEIRMFAMYLAVVAGVYAAQMAAGPLYQPGDVRAGKDVPDPLTPPATTGPQWRVAPNIELHHFEQGSGTPILVVHGGPGFPPTRPWQAGTLLSGDFRLIYYHQRGCGLSSRPIQSFQNQDMPGNMRNLHQTLGLPAQIADIERIRRILGIEKLILLGHSFGADIATLYAAEFPEHVQALVLVAPANMAVFPSQDPGLFERVRQRLPDEMKPEYGMYLGEYFDFRRAFQRTDAESSAFFARFGKFYGAATGGTAPQSSDAATAGFVPLAVFCSMGQRHDYSAAYKSVHVPTLVVHGENDLQPESVSRDFGAYFTNSRFVRIEGAGHFVFDDRPQEFAGEIRRFIAGL